VVRMVKQLRLELGGQSRVSLADISKRLHQSEAIASALSVRETQPPSLVEARPRAIPSRDELLELLRKHGGVVAHMALECGRSRKQVYRWVEHHGLSVEDFRRDA
jgi:transcriptional regulator of acetoin/glycerol metabolism